MTTDEATLLVTRLLALFTGMEPATITLDMRLEDELDIDSVDAAEMLIHLEQQTGMTFELEDLHDVDTVGSIIARLAEAVDA